MGKCLFQLFRDNGSIFQKLARPRDISVIVHTKGHTFLETKFGGMAGFIEEPFIAVISSIL
jgi:hypothetical protein